MKRLGGDEGRCPQVDPLGLCSSISCGLMARVPFGEA